MAIVDTDVPEFAERNKIVEDVLKLRRYLGNMNYADQFQRRSGKGQQNWEFEDKSTKTIFKPTLLGEIADATYGSLLKGKGNYKPRKNMPTEPLRDGTKVKNILVLRRITGSSVKAERAFVNQTAPLNKIKQLIEQDDEQAKQTPTNNGQSLWVDSTAELNELPTKRPLDLIIVGLPKKFGRPPPGTSTSHTKVITEVQPLTELSEEISPTSSPNIVKDPHTTMMPKVELGRFYKPSLLPDYSTEHFQLARDKLIQYDMRDIDGELIPAWSVEHELRAGTVVLVSAVLHIYNIQNDRGNSFRRYFQIDAERIKVVAKALDDHPLTNASDETKAQSDIKPPIIDDFADYMTRKRKGTKNVEEPALKKEKTIASSQSSTTQEDDEMYDM